jgi:hypothetical protein
VNCSICKCELDRPDNIGSRDCGGDCLTCMARCGDPHAIKELRAVADFCMQCSIDMFSKDFGDMKGLCKKGMLVVVLCEGCGAIQVDHTGKCVSVDCIEEHGQK